MTYLGIFYKDDGKVTIQEFYSINAVRIWINKNKHKYITYDIYIAKSINKEIE